MLGCLPLYHAFGLTCGLMATICTGSTFGLLPSFDPRRALEIVAAQHVTVIEAAAAMYTDDARRKRRLRPGLRLAARLHFRRSGDAWGTPPPI